MMDEHEEANMRLTLLKRTKRLRQQGQNPDEDWMIKKYKQQMSEPKTIPKKTGYSIREKIKNKLMKSPEDKEYETLVKQAYKKAKQEAQIQSARERGRKEGKTGSAGALSWVKNNMFTGGLDNKLFGGGVSKKSKSEGGYGGNLMGALGYGKSSGGLMGFVVKPKKTKTKKNKKRKYVVVGGKAYERG